MLTRCQWSSSQLRSRLSLFLCEQCAGSSGSGLRCCSGQAQLPCRRDDALQPGDEPDGPDSRPTEITPITAVLDLTTASR